MRKLFCTLCLLLVLVCAFVACDTEVPHSGNNTEKNPITGDSVKLVYAEAQVLGYEGSLDDFLALCKGKDGVDLINLVIDIEGNLLAYYTDDPRTPVNLGKVVGLKGDTGPQGPQGPTGEKGEDGIAPQLRINTTKNEWEISADGGKTWIPTGVKAVGADGKDGEDGEDGADGKDGEDGMDGVTPLIRINASNNIWEVSVDGGKTWKSTEVKATGAEGAPGVQGPQGDTGKTIEKVEFDAEGRLVITLTGGTVLPPVEMPKKDEHQHVFGEWITLKLPSCGVPGIRVRVCECGTHKAEETAATGEHVYSDWIVSVPITSNAPGEEKRTCTVCEFAETRVLTGVLLANSAQTDLALAYRYVHADGLGKLPNAYATISNPSGMGPYQEYEQVAVVEICTLMQKLIGINSRYFPITTDKDTTNVKEVLVGRVDREETRNVLTTLAVDEYAIAVVGNKVVITAWSEAALRVAVLKYRLLMQESLMLGENGEKMLFLPNGYRYVDSVKGKNWVTDFPKPAGEGISLYNAMDANDGALQLLYMGAGVNEQTYTTYCNTLKAQGYTVYAQDRIEGSIFTTFVNYTQGVALYVAYNAYAHQNEFGAYEWTMSKKIDTAVLGNVYDYDPSIRVVSAPLSSAGLIPQSLLTKQTYCKVTEPSITTVSLYQVAVGASYILTLEDGRFIVIDGGGVSDTGNEHEVLWETLATLHSRIYGQEPHVTHPIRIAAWVLSHGHWDHYNAFQQMVRKYGSTGLLRMEYMIANIPAEGSVYTLDDVAQTMTPEHIQTMQNQVKNGFQYIKVHTGQRLYFANAELQVLTTWEDLNPLVPNNGNDTCTVIRFSLSNTSNVSAAPVTFLYTGDANRWQSRYLCATYGDYLKSDMMSVAHHGNAGCEIELYKLVSPTVLWWPHNTTAAKNYLNPANKTNAWQYEVDQYFANELPSVQYIYMAGAGNNGYYYQQVFATTLVLGADGPNYENIYDALTGEKLEYTDISTDVHANVSPCMKK